MKPKTIKLYKAAPITKNKPVPGVIIEITAELPEHNFNTTMKQVEEFYREQAKILFEALSDNLPQGIIEPLMIEYFKRRVSLYRGRLEREGEIK